MLALWKMITGHSLQGLAEWPRVMESCQAALWTIQGPPFVPGWDVAGGVGVSFPDVVELRRLNTIGISLLCFILILAPVINEIRIHKGKCQKFRWIRL